MPLSHLFFWGVPIVALASYILLMFSLAISQKDKNIKIFMLALGALIVWTASAVLMRLELYPGVFFWNRIMIGGMLAVPGLIYLFVSVFVGTLSRFWMALWGVLTVAAMTAGLLGYVVSDARVVSYMVMYNGTPFKSVEFVYTLGPLATPVYVFMFIIIAAILIRAYKGIVLGTTTYSRISLIVLGVSIMFVGSLTNISPSLGKYPFDILTCFINALLITVAIYKYRLLELRFMVTKGLVYAFAVTIITGTYVYAVLFINRQTEGMYHQYDSYITIFSALITALIFQPLYRLCSNLVDKMFYKAEYSRRQALKNFSSVISNNLDLNSIAAELIEAVQLAIRANQVLIMIKDDDEENYSVFKTSSQLFKPDFQISTDNPIVTWFATKHTSLLRGDLYSSAFFKSMWEKEKRDIHDLGIEVIIPIRSRNDVIGMMMLTRKHNNTGYTLDDLDLLTYLGASMAVAFENARLFARSQNEAMTDSLTKLYNHRYFYKALAEQIAKVGNGELSVLMIDLDLFKLFNDLYGHIEGDGALEKIAAILQRNVGQKGVVCRYGGEEFTVLLPYHDSKMAYELAEKIRTDIEKTFFNMTDVTQRFLTASIGVCTYPHAAPNGEELLKRADLAMYSAKNSGKNQTVIYTPEVQPLTDNNYDSTEGLSSKPSYATTIYALTAAIDAKDHYTFGHSQKVAEYATVLASNLALDKSHVEIIREAALLHDIGKIGIPEHILTKTGRLTNEEFDIVKQHVEMSITIIKHLPSMNHVIPAVIGHHERWDGKGYPRGLRGENIPLAARILAVVDAFDAMTSNRPYRPALSVSAALSEIEGAIGTQFDPLTANIFTRLVREGTIKVDQAIHQIKSVS
ncbi:MAG: diguanylate cyclase [Syntrophomonadaceae bacterium]|nr:diguanylate cyclase [Syntrophomonadaceae bacterium]